MHIHITSYEYIILEVKDISWVKLIPIISYCTEYRKTIQILDNKQAWEIRNKK